jgi:hypothetical protein
LQLRGYVRQPHSVPYLIGQLPNGDYLFRDYGSREGPLPKAQKSPETFLVLTGPDFKSKQQTPLQQLAILPFIFRFQESTWLMSKTGP